MVEKTFAGDVPFLGGAKNSASPPPALQGAAKGMFVLKLSYNGVDIGYFGTGGTGGIWAKIVSTQTEARRLQWYPYAGKDYISDGGSMYMTWSGLSGGPVAVNDWAYACEWQITDGRLIAKDNANQLAQYSGSSEWLYANNNYNVLHVTVEPV
jgi:hypothetical protein